MAKRIPPFEVRPGESWLIHWPENSETVEVQYRVHKSSGGHDTAHGSYSADLFRRPPTAAVADWLRAELRADIERDERDRGRRGTNRPPKRPRWPKQ